MLHLAMVRSPFAHAKVTSIDTEAARGGQCRRRLTAADFPDGMGACANAWPITLSRSRPTTAPW